MRKYDYPSSAVDDLAIRASQLENLRCGAECCNPSVPDSQPRRPWPRGITRGEPDVADYERQALGAQAVCFLST